MESLAAGSVILIPFPFSDLSQSKIRPALKQQGSGLTFCHDPVGDRSA